MTASPQRLEVDQRILNKIAHDGQVLCGNERRELRNQHSAAHHPMINAPVVLEVFGSNMRNNVFGQSVKLGCKAAHGTPPPHGPRGISCALSSSRHKTNLYTPHNYGANLTFVNDGSSRQRELRHIHNPRFRFARRIGIKITAINSTVPKPNTAAHVHQSQPIAPLPPLARVVADNSSSVPCYAPTVPLPRYDAKPRPFAWSWVQERPSIISQVGGSATPADAASVFSVTSRGSDAAPIRRAA